MKCAVITPCGHFFHAACLKKWLYVQETCPLCHGQLKGQLQPTSSPPANENPAEVEQEQGEPQVELDTEEDTQAKNTPPVKTSAEPELGKDLPSGSSETQPKECDAVTESSTSPDEGLNDDVRSSSSANDTPQLLSVC